MRKARRHAASGLHYMFIYRPPVKTLYNLGVNRSMIFAAVTDSAMTTKTAPKYCSMLETGVTGRNFAISFFMIANVRS